jgi:8-amino-7-oxononanoate synthase
LSEKRRDLLDKLKAIQAKRAEFEAGTASPVSTVIEKVLGPCEIVIGGRPTLMFGSNNYFGLTHHPDVIAAAKDALDRFGSGTTGSRIANGTYAIHRELEGEIAQFMRRRGALVFPTGYQANLGMLAGLAGPRDVILMDADSHSSIYDGCRLSGATVVRFRHNDPADLDRRLSRLADQGECKLIVVEGIYSMLGDQAPLAELAEVKERHGAYLLVDEAHSVGVLGKHGRGAAEAQGVEAAVDFIAGTFSKSLGAVGGFVVSDHPKFDVLRFCCR